MDKTTHEVRLAQWKTIVEESENRPRGVSKHQWLKEHNIPEKRYYYWLRRIRTAAFNQMDLKLPAVTLPQKEDIVLAEIPGEGILTGSSKPSAVVIRTKKSTIELSGDLPSDTLIDLVKVLSHAL